MSVISAVAERSRARRAELKNPAVAAAAAPIAGKFMVVRDELGGTQMGLRDALCGIIERGLAKMGVTYKFPPADLVSNTKDSFAAMMAVFEESTPTRAS